MRQDAQSKKLRLFFYLSLFVLGTSCASDGNAPMPTTIASPSSTTCGVTSSTCTNSADVTVSTLGVTVSDGTIGNLGTDGTYLYSGSSMITRIDLTTLTATVLAGSTTQGYAVGSGASSLFSRVSNLVSDGSSLYFVDLFNHIVEKIDLTTSAISLVAGTPQQHGFQDTHPALYFSPTGIAIADDEKFVVDQTNYVIRHVNAQGTTRTIAGLATQRGSTDGRGSSARFNYPTSIVRVGPNLYVTDTSNHTIRKIVIATQRVSTLAGSPGEQGYVDGVGTAARFSIPQGLATDGKSLFVADTLNHVVRKVNVSTGEVTTLAGSGTREYVDGKGNVAGFIEPNSIVYLNNSLYLNDDSGVIRVIR